MPRTALGRARLTPRVDLVSRPLDFEGRTGTFKFEWRYAETEISTDPMDPGVTETRYQHGFTSPSPWPRPTDATRRWWSAACRDRLLWRADMRGGAVERWGRRTASVAAVGLVEALRVGNAMPCPQGAMGNAVAPKRWLSRPPPGRACAARRSCSLSQTASPA